MTDDEKRALLKEWNKATEEFLACPPTETAREYELGKRVTDVTRRCREVFGDVIPKSI